MGLSLQSSFAKVYIYTVYRLSLANSASVFHTLQMALRIALVCAVVTKFCNADECISFHLGKPVH